MAARAQSVSNYLLHSSKQQMFGKDYLTTSFFTMLTFSPAILTK